GAERALLILVVDDGGLHFGVLGPLVVSGPNGPISVPGPRQRALLIRLLIEANQPVSTARLVDDLWNGAPPESAPNTLQTYVPRLRQVLGPDRVRSRHRGYRIEAGPDELDSVLFEQELRQGSERLAAGAPAAAAAVLDRAVARWRG